MVNTSTVGPTATSTANCFQSFSFSNVSANASGSAGYGSLSVGGSDGSKDLTANFSSTSSFSDTLHLYGSNPGNQVLVQFVVAVTGQPQDTSPLPFPTQGFSASFTGGSPAVSPSETCTFSCPAFSQTYIVSQDVAANGEISFSGSLSGFGSTFAGGGIVTATLDLQSIALLDPLSGQPLSGFSYSTDSGTVYNLPATYIPEPSCWFLTMPALLALAFRLKNRNPESLSL